MLYCCSKSTQGTLLRNIFVNNYQEVQRTFQSVEWNPETIGRFQNSVHNNDYFVYCSNQHVRRTH